MWCVYSDGAQSVRVSTVSVCHRVETIGAPFSSRYKKKTRNVSFPAIDLIVTSASVRDGVTD